MPRYEFRVIPAPRRGEKAPGLRTTEDRFANSLEQAMNEMGEDGWDYVRTDILPCEERGLTGKRTITDQAMMVFRREIGTGPNPEDEGVKPKRVGGARRDDPGVKAPAPKVEPEE